MQLGSVTTNIKRLRKLNIIKYLKSTYLDIIGK